MPIPVSYQPAPSAIQYETDADGTLHIFIPPQPTGLAGRNRVIWLAFFVAPPMLIAVAAFVFRDLQTITHAAVAASFLAIFGLLVGWYYDLKFKRRVWIDVAPQQLAVRSQRGGFGSNRSFRRDCLRALDVIRDRNDDASLDAWLLRVHGRYEWQIVLDHLSRADSEEIAERLRAILQLPKSPD